jgi:small subunit ribosomal protein S3
LKASDKIKRNFKIEIREVKNPFTKASLVAEMAGQQIEKRIPFRQVLKKSIERVMQDKEIKGIRMEVSGRLNGAEMARTEWIRHGRVPLQTISANIDYSSKEAKTIYGLLGIKIWLFKD